ncbi:MAG: hypothetical protein WBD36_02540 [Bacteroidota bacterium]
MKSFDQEIKLGIQTTVIATVCSILMGFVFFRFSVFQVTSPAFQFVLFGFYASFLYAVFRTSSFQQSVGTFLLLVVLHEIVMNSSTFYIVLRDVVFLTALASAVYIFHQYFFGRLGHFPQSRPLILGALFTLSSVLATTILWMIHSLLQSSFIVGRSYAGSANLLQGFEGFLIGLAVGIGIELSILVKSKRLRFGI